MTEKPKQTESNLIGEQMAILEKLTRIEVTVHFIRKDLGKLLFGMLGIIGATVGFKYVGSPLWTDLAAYSSWFGGIFLLAFTISRWQNLDWPRRMLRLAFMSLLFTSVIVRTFVYQAGIEPAPFWYPPLMDMLMTGVSGTFVWVVWKRDPGPKE